jgi:outer membrane immunogenic protein
MMALLWAPPGGAGAQEAPASATKWSGFAIGGEVGASFASFAWTQSPNFFNTIGATVLGSESDSVAAGLTGGVLGGYNWAVGRILLGIELSARTGGLSKQQPSPWYPATDVFTSEIHWRASAAARVGYAWERWQIFAKGGWAGADVGFTLLDTSTGITSTLDKWINGWTAGVGAEYMMLDRVSLGVTWDYTDLSAGGLGMSCAFCGFGVGLGTPVVDSHIRLNAVMARLTYHFEP